jgi:Phage portal protein
MADPRSLVRTPLMKRLTQAVTYGLTGGFFSPQAPLQPQHQETAGRRLDYLAGFNIATKPRRDSGIDFQTLRNFAKFYDLLRVLIEKRKDQIANFDWSIVPTDEAVAAGEDTDVLNERAAAAMKFLKYPDGRQKWNTWIRALIEDMLVLDAVTVWPVYDGTRIKRLETVDPATIKIVIDESGRRPEPPLPAYQQVLHGVPTSDYQAGELLYFISNPSSDRIYGLSKVEQIVITIQIGLRREMSQLQFFTDGNIPAALAGVPQNWNMSQIQAIQTAFDALLQGDTASRRRLWFVPGDTAKNIHEFRSEDSTLKAAFDEWLMRVMCFTFGISPTPFINQVNRATAFTAQEEARDEGLGPTLTFLKGMMDAIITQAMKLEGVEFKWSMEPENDPQTQSSIDDQMLKNGSRSLDELRQRDGLEPYGIGAMVYLPVGPVLVSTLIENKGMPPQAGGGAGAAGAPHGDANPPDDGKGGAPPGSAKADAEAAPKPDKAVAPVSAPGKRPIAQVQVRKPIKTLGDGTKVSEDRDVAAPLAPTKKVEEAGLRKAEPFRHGRLTNAFGYAPSSFRSPKAEAARRRLIEASKRAGAANLRRRLEEAE